MATVYLLPNADGTLNEWRKDDFPAPGDHYLKVDDLVGSPDEDTTYVHTFTQGDIEEFNHETASLLLGATITNVVVTARMKFTGTPFESDANIGLKVAGTRYPAVADTPLTSSYANHVKEWANNPADGQPWEKSDIDNIQTSIEATALSGMSVYFRCTQIYLTVSYIPINPLIGKSLVRHDIINKVIIR